MRNLLLDIRSNNWRR